MKHLDLFSGIGGFTLATEMVWDDVEHTFCDNDPFCQAILKKHWPNSPIYGDIRTLTADAEHKGRIWRGSTSPQNLNGLLPHQQKGEETRSATPRRNEISFDLLTGGFPCQPFSQAGKRRGTEDDRHLWPEMLRVIREFHPRWVIGENVGGFVTWNNGMVLEQVQSDLESEGYSVQAFVIPAVAVNAPHRRDRVWIVANRNSGESNTGNVSKSAREAHTQSRADDTDKRNAPDTSHAGLQGNEQPRTCGVEVGKGRTSAHGSTAERDNDVADDASSRSRRNEEGTRQREQRNRVRSDERTNWNENWSEVATRLCTLDDGLPNGLARPKGWRNAALKGAGNAIVPQVAAEIMRAIKSVDDTI